MAPRRCRGRAFGGRLPAEAAGMFPPRHAFFSSGAHDFTQRRFAAFISVKNAGIDLDCVPFLAILVIWVAKEFVVLNEMLEKPCSPRRIVGYAKQNRTGRGAEKFKCLRPFLVVPAPGSVDAGNRAFARTQILLFRFSAFDEIPEVKVDATLLVRIRQTDNFYQPRLEGIVDREIRNEPFVERAFRFGGAGAIPRRSRAVCDN